MDAPAILARTARAALAALLVLPLLAAAPAQAAPADGPPRALAPHVDGALIVGFRPGAAAADRAAARASVGALSARPISPLAADTEVLTLPAGRGVEAAMAALSRNPNVRFAEPDYLLTKSATSNDPRYIDGSLWGMYGSTTSPANAFGSNAGAAWAAGHTGSRDVVVVVIDEGIDVQHPDLSANIWTNPFEIAGNGIDDDGNGYIDDVHGWDFYSNDASVYDGADNHGTHVAGTIGGVGGNGVGVVGVNWSVTMVSAKFLGSGGGSTSNAVRAVDYANDLKTRHGMDVVATSNSWGGGGYSQALLDAIERGGDRGILFIAAAGNSSSNNDAGNYYPANYECTRGGTRGWDCVVTVASTTSTGALSSFSSYGATRVDLGAPGSSILSTLQNNTYGSYSGTSMATPHVSGAVALCAAADPTLTAAQLRELVLATTAPTGSLAGRTVTGGRLDVGALLAQCGGEPAELVGQPTALAASAATEDSVALTWVDGTSGETRHEIERAAAGCTDWVSAGTAGANATSLTVSGLTASTTHCFRVRAVNGVTGAVSPWTDPATATTPAAPPAPRCEVATHAWVDIASTGTARTLADDAGVEVPIGFTAWVAGRSVDRVVVSSNGYLTLAGQSGTAYGNGTLPDGVAPDGMVAVLWDDLNPSKGGSVRTQTIGSVGSRRFVVSWLDIQHYATVADGVSFQAVIEEATGRVLLQYRDVSFGTAAYDFGASATIGVEHAGAMLGTTVAANRAALSDGLTLACVDADGPAQLGVLTVSLPGATAGSAYSRQLSGVNGSGSLTWSRTAGSLPSGISLSSAGVLSGTPSASGSFPFTVQVRDGSGATATQQLVLEVAGPPSVVTTSLPDAVVGSAYSRTLEATGGTTPYRWSLASGALPSGLTLSDGGTISGTPSATGTASFTVRVTDAAGRSGTQALSLTVSAAAMKDLVTDEVDLRAFSTNKQGTAATASVRLVDADGQPVAGASLSARFSNSVDTSTSTVQATTGSDGRVTLTSARFRNVRMDVGHRITLTVTSASATGHRFQATAADSASRRVASPVAVTTSSLAGATKDAAYGPVTLGATGGEGSYTWALIGGAPAGLTLSGAGVLSGTPTQVGSFSVTVRASDTGSPAWTAERTLTLVVADPAAVRTADVASVTVSLGRANKSGTPATATVRVVEVGPATGVGGVVVTGTWSVAGSVVATSSGTTGADGSVAIASPRLSVSGGQEVRFTVTSIALDGWQSAAPSGTWWGSAVR
jgi:subtilisin family serine protease